MPRSIPIPHTHTKIIHVSRNNRHKYQLVILERGQSTQNKLDTSSCRKTEAFTQVFSRHLCGLNVQSFTGNWNRKMEPGNDSFGQVCGYPDTQHSLRRHTVTTCTVLKPSSMDTQSSIPFFYHRKRRRIAKSPRSAPKEVPRTAPPSPKPAVAHSHQM